MDFVNFALHTELSRVNNPYALHNYGQMRKQLKRLRFLAMCMFIKSSIWGETVYFFKERELGVKSLFHRET